MAAYFANFDIPMQVDPMPNNGSGRTGSLPSLVRPDTWAAQSQVSVPTIIPNQKPGTHNGFNRGFD